jgi:hypothetical protein
MLPRYFLLFLICTQWLLADCHYDTSSYKTVIERAACSAEAIVIGHAIKDLPNSKNYAYLPTYPIKKNHHEYTIKIDTIIKGKMQCTLSVFCNSTSTICYDFETNKWPLYALNSDSSYILFLRQDSIASKQLHKKICNFIYAFQIKDSAEIVPICKNVVVSRCDDFNVDTSGAAIGRAIINSLNSANKTNRKK